MNDMNPLSSDEDGRRLTAASEARERLNSPHIRNVINDNSRSYSDRAKVLVDIAWPATEMRALVSQEDVTSIALRCLQGMPFDWVQQMTEAIAAEFARSEAERLAQLEAGRLGQQPQLETPAPQPEPSRISDEARTDDQPAEPGCATREGSFGNDTPPSDGNKHNNEATTPGLGPPAQSLDDTATEAAKGVEAGGASGGEPTAGDPARLAPDGHVVHSFLQWLTQRWGEFPGALLQLDSGDPHKRQWWIHAYFPIERLAQAAAWAAQRNRMGRNIYVGVNPRRPDLDQKESATDKEVLGALFNFADLDDAAAVARAETDEGLGVSARVITGTVPSLRLHLYWERETAARNLTAWTEQQRAIAAALGGDAVIDPRRIMKLPGTVSYPSEDKAKRGYIAESHYTLALLYHGCLPRDGGSSHF
jgi:hypothetical protein